jgi:hypothetical protein
MKMYRGVDVYIRVSLSSTLVVGERSVLRSGRFTPSKDPPPPVQLDWRQGGLQNSVMKWENEYSWPYRDSSSGLSVNQPVNSR